jgi:protein TonB
MKNLKKQPTKQLEKFSNIFTQLGLVLVLFIVYVTLEYETPKKQFTVSVYDASEPIIIQPDQILEFTIEPKIKPKVDVIKNNALIIDAPIEKVDNNKKETVFIDEPEKDPVQLDINTLVEVVEPVIDTPETVPYIMIQNAPVFKGCEGLSKVDNKKCFDKKMKRFVQRNFNLELASELGLSSGKYKIQTQFIIDDKGNVVDIKIRAPHIKLKKETQQLIEKLPKFTPGKQSDKPVKVRYTLPISFQVD